MKCNMNKESESDDDFMVDSIISSTYQRKLAPSLPDKDPEFPFLSQNELYSLKTPKHHINHISSSIPFTLSSAPTASSSSSAIRQSNTPRFIRVNTKQNIINTNNINNRIIIKSCNKSQDDICLNKTTNNLSQPSIICTGNVSTIPNNISTHYSYHNSLKFPNYPEPSQIYKDAIESSSSSVLHNNSSILSHQTMDYSHSTATTNTDSDETHSIESSPEFLLCNDPIITAFVLDNDNNAHFESNFKDIESDENLENNRKDFSFKSTDLMPCSDMNKNRKKTKSLKTNPMSFDTNNYSPPSYLSTSAHQSGNSQTPQFMSSPEFMSPSHYHLPTLSDNQFSKPYISTVGSVDDNLLMAMRCSEESALYNPSPESSNLLPVSKPTVNKPKNKKAGLNNTMSKNKKRNSGHKRIPKKMMNKIARNSHIIQQETDSNTTAVIKVSKSSLYRRNNSNNSSSGKKLKPLKPNYANSLSQRKSSYKTSTPNDDSTKNNRSFQLPHESPVKILPSYSNNNHITSSNSKKQNVLLVSKSPRVSSYSIYETPNHVSLHERNLNIYNSNTINTAVNVDTNDHLDGENSDKKDAKHNVNCPQKKRKHLLQFIIDLLKEDHPCVEWFDKVDKEFSIVQPDMLTKLWARYKHNDKMTFDSLARSLRLYYLPKKLERIPGKKNHYRLLPKAFAKSP